MSEWEPEAVPWIRAEAIAANGAGVAGRGFARCYFCGSDTIKLAGGDDPKDTGRIELYCSNQYCEARTITVVVMRDSYSAQNRADVRILNALDEGRTSDPVEPRARSLAEMMDDTSMSIKEVRRRRTHLGPVTVGAYGHGGEPVVPASYRDPE